MPIPISQAIGPTMWHESTAGSAARPDSSCGQTRHQRAGVPPELFGELLCRGRVRRSGLEGSPIGIQGESHTRPGARPRSGP